MRRVGRETGNKQYAYFGLISVKVLQLHARASEHGYICPCLSVCQCISYCKSKAVRCHCQAAFFTPHVTLWRVGCNSFDIVCVSVCLCVCLCVRLTLTAKRMDIQTWISVCRSSGRISRSSSMVKVIGQRSKSLGQKTFFRVANSVWNWIHSTPYMNGRATTWGVFKAYAFFFFLCHCFFNYTRLWPLTLIVCLHLIQHDTVFNETFCIQTVVKAPRYCNLL